MVATIEPCVKVGTDIGFTLPIETKLIDKFRKMKVLIFAPDFEALANRIHQTVELAASTPGELIRVNRPQAQRPFPLLTPSPPTSCYNSPTTISTRKESNQWLKFLLTNLKIRFEL